MILILTLLCPLLCPFLYGETLSVEELRSIQGKFKSTEYLSLDFQQTRFFSSRPNRPVKSTGNAQFAKPSKFNWSTAKPASESWIFDGQTLFQVKDGKALDFGSAGKSTQDLQRIVSLVLNFEDLLKDYRLVKAEKNKEGIEIELLPTTPGVDLERLFVKFDEKQNLVRSLKMVFKNKSYSVFEFSNPRTAAIDASVFGLPAGMKPVKIIEGS